MILRSLFLCLLLLCVACPGAGTPPRRAEEPTRRQPRTGGTLKVVLAADVDSLDPHAAARPSSWFFARALHRGLFAFPAAPLPRGTQPVADLAESVPGPGTTLIIRVRDDVRFSNGDEVTPGDVVASLERLKRTRRGIARYLKNVRVGALSGRRVRFVGGGADLQWILAHPQAAIVPAATPPWGKVSPRKIAGAGPYRIASHRLERRITLERNDGWDVDLDPVRGGYVDRIDARLGGSPASLVRSVRRGDADLVVDPGPPDLSAPRVPRGRTTSVSAGCLRYLFLNVGVEPFDDRRIRRAVAHAMRRATLPGVRTVSPPAPRILPPVVSGHRDDPVIAESPERARRLLREAGKRKGFTTRLVIADSPRDRAEARAIRDSLRRVGIRTRVTTDHPASVYPDRYGAPSARTPMGIATWCADWPGLAGRTMLRPIAASNAGRSTRFSGFSSRRVDDLLNRARGSAHAWGEADRAVTGSAAIIPLVWPNEVSVLSDRVQGWSNAPMFPRGDPATLWLDLG